ncbi:hypothetical protein [Thioclava indica]|uniref:Uncharacterized protein n=1 Tax=Thioclava indica TaxID=1353528 RepID=A0A074JS64_9RHOB|nr:hypothetical protein [Thioclava indica]KEO59314.1 hypothetical protein DT23_04345 [Thioclava indica]
MGLIDDLAENLAHDVIEAQLELDEDRFYIDIGDYIGTSSPSLQEAFMTACRLRLAELRGRTYFEKRLGERRKAKAAAAADGAPK